MPRNTHKKQYFVLVLLLIIAFSTTACGIGQKAETVKDRVKDVANAITGQEQYEGTDEEALAVVREQSGIDEYMQEDGFTLGGEDSGYDWEISSSKENTWSGYCYCWDEYCGASVYNFVVTFDGEDYTVIATYDERDL